MGKMIVFASGRGGEGKTTLAALLGAALASHGRKVCIVDANIGMRSMDLYLNTQDRVVFDWYDLANEECTMEQALLPLDEQGKGYILSAPQAMLPEDLDEKVFSALLKRLKKRFDYVLFDAPGGISQLVRQLIKASDACYFVTKDDALSQRCTERITFVARETNRDLPMYLLFNHIQNNAAMTPDAISAYLDVPMIGVISHCAELQALASGEQSITACKNEALMKTIDDCALRMEGQDVPFPTVRTRRISWLSRIKR